MFLSRFPAQNARGEDLAFDPDAWRDFLAYFKGRHSAVALCLCGAAGQSLVALPMIPLVRLAFDRAIPGGEVGLLIWIAGALAGLRILGSLSTVWVRAAVVGLKAGVIQSLRRDLLLRLYERPYVSHARGETQLFAAHMVVDCERLDAMIDAALGAALPAAFTGVALGVALLWLNAALVAVGVALLPLLWAAGRFASRRMKANFGDYHRAYDAFILGVRFVLDTFALTRARGAEAAEVARQMVTVRALRQAGTHLAVDNVRVGQIQSGVIGLVGLVMLVAGGIAVGRHDLTVGGLLAFFAAGGLAGAQVERLIGALPNLVEGAAALARIRGHLTASGPPPYAGRRVLDWTGDLTLDGVGFSFGDKPILRGVSIDLRAGARVGIVGANGAGKTTILNLMMGLHRPGSGRLSADGVGFDELDIVALRRQIGLAPQHPVFFRGSVFENIAYGAPDLTREDVAAAADRIGAGRLLRGLPGGLDAPLGEGGLMLSGGERQVIAVLRAMATRPKVLLLDEPTTNLDAAAVAALLEALAASCGGPTMVLVSHDPAAMAGLHEVYRLEAGRLRRTPGAPGPVAEAMAVR